MFLASLVPPPAFAFPGQALLLDTGVPLIWLLLAGIVLIGVVVVQVRLRAQLQAAQESAAARVSDLQAENAKLFREVQARVHELMERDKLLEEVKLSAEQNQEEHRDFLSLTGHRMRKPLETLVSTMSLLARGGDDETRHLAEAALGQCRTLRSNIEEIQRAGQDTPQGLETAAAPAAAALGMEETDHPLSILLVENDSHPSLRRRLEASGHQVRCESNGVDGAEAALKSKYDLVMIDVRLPLIDGVETANKMRGDYSNDNLLIFGMLDNLKKGDREHYVAKGLSGVLPSEPTDAQLTQLLSWVEQKSQGKSAAGKPGRTNKVLNASTLERQRDTLGHLAFAELLGDRLANLPKKITAFTSALTGRHWLDAQHQAQAIAAEAESVGLEVVSGRLKALSARLSIDSERDYCRHQRTEILGLMRTSIQQLKSWREKNVHTEWALR
uniref:response regulator n=1 Tax=Microbulbifer agarilyticus TaxID=260552 RepID=UPI0002FF061B|nr:response regulator [Microbulbifer agarilyticus]